MKKLILISIFIANCFFAVGQEKKAISNGFGVGFQLGQIQEDFGIGINITTPFFFENKVAVRLRGNMAWNEHLENQETTWTPYTNFSIGVIGVGGNLNKYIRLYGEGGIILLFPADKFSTESMESGGYGLFGFEFFHTTNLNYFIEIGGVGTGAKKNQIPTKPIYSNGLLINAGLRVQF